MSVFFLSFSLLSCRRCIYLMLPLCVTIHYLIWLTQTAEASQKYIEFFRLSHRSYTNKGITSQPVWTVQYAIAVNNVFSEHKVCGYCEQRRIELTYLLKEKCECSLSVF